MDPLQPSPLPSDPEQRLVAAAIEQIEKLGLAQLTVRAVAAAAGMNVAAVNYYFRTKDALISAALEGTIRHMVADSEAFLARMPKDPERVLGDLLAYYLEGSLRYPRISKAHLHDAFVADNYEGAFTSLFAPVMQKLRQALKKAVPGLSEKEATRRVVAALSAMFFPAFFLGFYRSLGALDSPAERVSYAHDVALRTLAPPASRLRTRR
jgi:AcrR family transcriptional regulator